MKPLLSATLDDINQLTPQRFPLLVSEKLDGIRAIKYNGQLVSRNLKPIPNKFVQKKFALLPEGVDGELIVGEPTSKTCFRDTTSGVMSEDGEPDVAFYAFDFVDEFMPYTRRLKMLEQLRKPKFVAADIVVVQQHVVLQAKDILKLESRFLHEGYEGVMLRDPAGAYKYGRSSLKEGYLIKLKRFKDSEAKILDVEELQHNKNAKTTDNLGHAKRSSHKAGKVGGDTLGALKVKDLKTGVEFDIGSGFTAADRAALWADREAIIGRIVKYKYFPTGSKEKPRFPVYLGIRDRRDM